MGDDDLHPINVPWKLLGISPDVIRRLREQASSGDGCAPEVQRDLTAVLKALSEIVTLDDWREKHGMIPALDRESAEELVDQAVGEFKVGAGRETLISTLMRGYYIALA
jgi:hypothetical protein